MVVGTATRYCLPGSGLEPRRARDFLFSTPVQSNPGPTHPPVEWIREPFSKDKGAGPLVDDEPPSSTEVKTK